MKRNLQENKKIRWLISRRGALFSSYLCHFHCFMENWLKIGLTCSRMGWAFPSENFSQFMRWEDILGDNLGDDRRNPFCGFLIRLRKSSFCLEDMCGFSQNLKFLKVYNNNFYWNNESFIELTSWIFESRLSPLFTARRRLQIILLIYLKKQFFYWSWVTITWTDLVRCASIYQVIITRFNRK